MRWKLLLAIILIVGIAVLVLLKFGPRQIVNSMTALFTLFSTPQTGSQFRVEFTAKSDALVGQKFEASFLPTGISIEKLVLENVDGEVKRYKNNQWFSQSLTKGSIEISNFLGTITFDPNASTITLTGYASRVKGTNFEGSIFEWVG